MSNLYSYLENIYSKLSNCCVIICKDYPDDTEVINKSIPNFRKLVCIFGGVMPQTRRRRSRRSSGYSTWRPHEQRTEGSSSHSAPPPAPTSVNWDDDLDDFMPPKPWPPTFDVPPELEASIGLCCNINKGVKFRIYNSIFNYSKNYTYLQGFAVSLLLTPLFFFWIFGGFFGLK